MDSHVQFVPGSLARLLTFSANGRIRTIFGKARSWRTIRQGLSSHFSPVWSNGMYGQWAADECANDVNAAPFEMGMQGLGVFTSASSRGPVSIRASAALAARRATSTKKSGAGAHASIACPSCAGPTASTARSVPIARLTRKLNYLLGYTRFKEAGIRWMALKGAARAMRDWDTGLRAMADLDVLIQPEDLARAAGVLTGAGYRAEDDATPDAILRQARVRHAWQFSPLTRTGTSTSTGGL